MINKRLKILNQYKTKKLSLNNKVFTQIKYPKYIKGQIVRNNIRSHHLNNYRDIDIYLPPSYFNSNKKYPVLYMHDGNNLFHPEIAFAGVPWHVNKTVDKLINTGLIEEIIVVGIHNTIDRNAEYTWTQNIYRNGFTEGGNGSKYARFIVDELKPFIDHHYKTLPDSKNTAVAGSSLGGLISFYMGLYYPHIFSNIGVISPSLWWGHGRAIYDVKTISQNLKIWLDMGTKESGRINGHDVNIALAQHFKYELQKNGYYEGYNLAYLEDRGGKHNEKSWGQRLHIPLIFFFGKKHSLIFSKV